METLSEQPLIPDFVKFMSPNKSLIEDLLEKSEPNRETPLEASQCKGVIRHIAYRYNKGTGLCTAVIRIE